MVEETNHSETSWLSGRGITEPLEEKIKEVEAAAHGWGVRPTHPEARFIAAILAALRALGRLVGAALEEMREITRKWQGASETEIEKLREANRSAALAIRQAEIVQETIVTNVCKQLVKNITSESGRWLVLAEQNIHRRRRWRYAAKVTLVVMLLLGAGFLGGYQMRTWEDEPAVQSLARCMKEPLRVVVEGGHPTGDWACKLETLVPRTWRDMRPALQFRWLGLWPYGSR